LFHDTLMDVYFAENKIVEVLPKMHEAAKSNELKSASKSISWKPRSMSLGSKRFLQSSARSRKRRPVPQAA
jgi:hypothetical protein